MKITQDYFPAWFLGYLQGCSLNAKTWNLFVRRLEKDPKTIEPEILFLFQTEEFQSSVISKYGEKFDVNLHQNDIPALVQALRKLSLAYKSKVINKFFAVTQTSLYLIAVENGSPFLKKLAKKGESDVSVGEVLSNGTMLSVGRQLILFVPEGGGNSFETDILKVNTRYWGDHTSEVTGLFLKKRDAVRCFKRISNTGDWSQYSKDVLDQIGEKNPYFSIPKDSFLI